MQELPTIQSPPPAGELSNAQVEAMSAEVEELARSRDAVILPPTTSLPELQDVAH